MTDKPLEQRAGRNIGIESLAVFRQAAGAPEVVATIGSDIDASPGPQVTVMEGVEKAVRTPTLTGAGAAIYSGYAFNNEASVLPQLKFYFQDELGNKMLIANVSSPLGGGPIDLSVSHPSGDANPFTPFQPLGLCVGEKIVMRAGYPTPPIPA